MCKGLIVFIKNILMLNRAKFANSLQHGFKDNKRATALDIVRYWNKEENSDKRELKILCF